jgi:chemotaxis protein methyltransferase CheR
VTERTRTEQHEVDLLLEAIYREKGYDFRQYARASLQRRIHSQLKRHGLVHISELIPLYLHSEAAFDSFLKEMSITVTDMFRDPPFYKRFRELVIPKLKTWPFVKIWCAGCATGEEVYSLAIVLKEENFYDRCQIYATDYNNHSLHKAREGIYPLAKLQQYSANYNKSGAKFSFADYYHADYNGGKILENLKKKIVFSHHNLVVDAIFGEMNVIICRNVLIYFNRQLQNRVLSLFDQSLCHGGFLCLGTKETLQFSSIAKTFEVVADQVKIYRKTYQTEGY